MSTKDALDAMDAELVDEVGAEFDAALRTGAMQVLVLVWAWIHQHHTVGDPRFVAESDPEGRPELVFDLLTEHGNECEHGPCHVVYFGTHITVCRYMLTDSCDVVGDVVFGEDFFVKLARLLTVI